MKNLRRRVVPLLALLVLLCGVMTVNAFAADDPTEEIGTKMIECPDCGAVVVVLTDEGTAAACESCGGTGYVESSSRFFNTFWSLLPPIIAIALALITKEVYSSLFIGIVVGGLLYSNFAFEATVLHVFNDGIVASVTDMNFFEEAEAISQLITKYPGCHGVPDEQGRRFRGLRPLGQGSYQIQGGCAVGLHPLGLFDFY